MRGKEEVINDVLHDYNSQIKTWLKTRLNGAWDNGYCHGKEDALKEFFEAPKPLTHADRIRAMSDEELAEFIQTSDSCPQNKGDDYPICDHAESCQMCWLDWLRQEENE